jgi:DNA-binding HxlR family transcriptional regulator
MAAGQPAHGDQQENFYKPGHFLGKKEGSTKQDNIRPLPHFYPYTYFVYLYLLFIKYLKNSFYTLPEFLCPNKLYYNPVEFALDRIGGTWKMPILWRLKDRVKRYGELKKDIPRITHKMLTSQLRELEAEGFIVRTAFPVVPPKVEYPLTLRGAKSHRGSGVHPQLWS